MLRRSLSSRAFRTRPSRARSQIGYACSIKLPHDTHFNQPWILVAGAAVCFGGTVACSADQPQSPLEQEIAVLREQAFARGLACGSSLPCKNEIEPTEDEVINWSSTHSVSTKLHQAESVEQIEELVREYHSSKTKLRVVGSALSPNGLGLRYLFAILKPRVNQDWIL
jgi:hypothetical protein